MSTDPCSYKNPTASKTACIANGGKPTSDPCNVLNPLANSSSCASSEAAKELASSGIPTWAKVLIGVLVFLVVVGVFLFSLSGGTSDVMSGGGKRRGGGRKY
jgi:hypothetical protein